MQSVHSVQESGHDQLGCTGKDLGKHHKNIMCQIVHSAVQHRYLSYDNECKTKLAIALKNIYREAADMHTTDGEPNSSYRLLLQAAAQFLLLLCWFLYSENMSLYE